jgi:hypothetical protein
MVSRGEATHTLIGVGAAFVGIMIYNHFLPSIADIRTAEPFNPDVETAERQALFASTAFVLVTAGLTKSIEVFIVGGLGIVLVDYITKHANAVHPDTGKMVDQTPRASGLSESFPMPDYATP